MLCRLCLRNNENVHNIINSELKCSELTLIESLYWVFGVEVDINDSYTKFICAQCENVVQYIGSYRTLYQRNQLLLQGKLDREHESDEWIDQLNFKTTDKNEQVKDTTKHTSNEPEHSPDVKRRRYEFIKYYYEVPTTAIRELITKEQTSENSNGNKNKRHDDRPLFNVNETVHVEVCEYCSEIFKSKGLLNNHYRVKHTKRRRRRKKCDSFLKTHLQKRKTIFRKTEMLSNQQTPERRSIFNRLLEQETNSKKLLLDAKNFPNLNFVKELEKESTASKETVEPKDSLTKESVQDKTTANHHITTPKTVNDGIIVQLDHDYLKNTNDKYRWLNLKEFYISLKRCEVPSKFCDNPNTELKENEPKTNRIDDSENTDAEDNDDISFEDDYEIELNTIENYSKGQEEDSGEDITDAHLGNIVEKDQDKLKRLKDLCVPIERCKALTKINSNTDVNHELEKPETELIEEEMIFKHSIIPNKFTKMKQWKNHVSGILQKLQRIKTVDKDERIIQIADSANTLRDGDKNAQEDSIDVEIQDDNSDVEVQEDNTDLEIQTTSLNDDCNLRSKQNTDRKEKGNILRGRKVNLKNLYISLERCPIPESFYQNKILKEKLDNSNSKVPERREEKKTVNNITTSNKKPQHILKWKQNFYATLHKVTKISEQIKNVKDTKENEKTRKRKREDTKIDDNNRKRANIRDVKVLLPKIDQLLRKRGYIIDKIDTIPIPDETNGNLEASLHERSTPVPQEPCPMPPDCMPELEKVSNERQENVSDIPPKLERQVSPELKFLKKKRKPKSLKPKPCKLRRKVQHNKEVIEEMLNIATEMEQLIDLLNLIEIKDDNFLVNNNKYLFEGLPINNWKERIFRSESVNQNSEFETLTEEEACIVSHTKCLEERMCNSEITDKDSDKINENNSQDHQDKSDICNNTKSCETEATEDNSCQAVKNIEIITTSDQSNICKNIETETIADNSFQAIKNIENISTTDKSSICKNIQTETITDNSCQAIKNTENISTSDSVLPDTNKSDEKGEVRTWKTHISDVLLRLKNIKKDTVPEENSKDDLKEKNEPKLLSEHDNINIAEEEVLNTTTSSNSTEQSDKLSESLELSDNTDCTKSVEALNLTASSDTNKKLLSDDFSDVSDSETEDNENTQNLQSIIKSRWSSITKGNNSIVSEIFNPLSDADLSNFAHSIVKDTLERENM